LCYIDAYNCNKSINDKLKGGFEMAVANPVELSGYITAMAVSARTAQAVMSTGLDPMAISEFRFKVNISAAFSVTSETDVSLDIWRLSIKEKITIGYKNEWGVEIECKIIPVVALET
jgi:hypothetical protein